ncbi:conserved hypothetical protein [Syntrophobacter sp. SbD1]|nr:conserved hypothetical protein [Syntrophobacter sp. SbD1]
MGKLKRLEAQRSDDPVSEALGHDHGS